ncbi:twitching motility protein [Gaiella occulta]|uniref:Twitching motility protein n=1 Tax=Gaiella occulta TaxID=1002870 RepID=A0A7M2YTV2_9ACTN|nr:PilT/PilU family type 4a pilus ATPase [Gaiella occulta]RDI73572.1 twitching motility protein [Gaiella occulta]
MIDLIALLRRAVDGGASDVHLKLGQPPVVRLDGDLEQMHDVPALTESDLEDVLDAVTQIAPRRRELFEETGDLDIAFAHPTLPRFRVNGFRQRGAVSFAFRAIPSEIPDFAALGLPPGVSRLAEERRGLVLVTGATGSGKTTTLASMLDHVNRTRRQHIVTIEDPIEILHPDRGCIVNQREVGLDTESFEQALRRVLRQDPDVILIGELRDTETAHTALQAAESGHLVFSTLHTIDAAETVGRMIELFPPGKQQQVRSILAGTLRGVISQRLLVRADGGRVPAVEVMVTNARIADLIRENRPNEISDAIAAGEFFQMQTFAQSLIDLVLAGVVEPDVAANASTNRHDFLVALERAEKDKLQREHAAENGGRGESARDRATAVQRFGSGLR